MSTRGQNPKNPLSDVPIGNIVPVIAALGFLLVVGLMFFSSAVSVVDAGTRGVLKRFGEVQGILPEGLNFRTPFVTDVTIVDVRTQRHQSDSTAASRDLQTVTTQVVLNYRPDPSRVDELIREIGTDYVSIVVDPAIQESVKAATAQYTAEELITQRPNVSQSIREVLQSRLEPRHIIVEDLSITDFRFSEEFARAIEAKQVAEQEALRAERELERARIEAQQRVARADAEAEARLAVAQAEAEALRLQREVISPELLQLRFIEKWNGELPRLVAGNEGVMPLLSIPADELDVASNTPAVAPDTERVLEEEAETETSTTDPDADTENAGTSPTPSPTGEPTADN